MKIRLATIDDAEKIAFIHVLAWQQSYKGIIDQGYLDSISYDNRLEMRKRQLEHNHLLDSSSITVYCLVAVLNEKIIGFCDVGATKLPSCSQNSLIPGEIYAIYLLGEYKGKGIGNMIWEKALSYLRKSNLLPFRAWVLSSNIPARNFYEKHGGMVTEKEQVQIGRNFYEEVCYIFNENKII